MIGILAKYGDAIYGPNVYGGSEGYNGYSNSIRDNDYKHSDSLSIVWRVSARPH